MKKHEAYTYRESVPFMQGFFNVVTKFLLTQKKPDQMDENEFITSMNREMGYSDVCLTNSDFDKMRKRKHPKFLSKVFKIGFNSISGSVMKKPHETKT